MEPDISLLMSDISFWETWGYVALGAVLIGVAGESVKEFTTWLEYIGWEKRISRLSALVLIAGLAGEGITQPNTNAANAKLIAFLNNQTAQFRAEQERLKSLIIWRSIPADKRQNLVAKLATTKATITLMVIANDPEAFVFASQLTKVFADAHWEAIAQSASWGNLLPEDVLLPGPDNETVTLLRQAFTEAGIKFTTDSIRPPDASIVFDTATKTAATVVVGSRLGPFK